MRKFILYNPLAGNEQTALSAMKLDSLYIGHETIYLDILEIESYKDFFAGLAPDDDVIICGGDGTLNRFINRIRDIEVKNNIYYYATGSGNDFLNDLEKPRGSEPFLINDYIKILPTVEINGAMFRFFNGIGFGIEGTCCAVGNKQRATSKKKVNYTAIALKLILFSFRPKTAKITVDGEVFEHKKVWLASSMFGRFFGGGMKVAPDQKRGSDTLSLVVAHDCGALRLLTVFPSIFSGTHTKYTKYISIYEGREISVEYDTPCEVQIDGETLLDVKAYSAKAPALKETLTPAE